MKNKPYIISSLFLCLSVSFSASNNALAAAAVPPADSLPVSPIEKPLDASLSSFIDLQDLMDLELASTPSTATGSQPGTPQEQVFPGREISDDVFAKHFRGDSSSPLSNDDAPPIIAQPIVPGENAADNSLLSIGSGRGTTDRAANGDFFSKYG